MREGRYICDGIATDESVRGQGVGKLLLFAMIDEARVLGADALYLVARAPGFFNKNGFEMIQREDAPTFFECFSCSQYKKTCHPEVMRLPLPG
jgi:amino-acid N-acetyltransferase